MMVMELPSLVCPCGCEQLHQCAVVVWRRAKEDSTDGVVWVFDPSGGLGLEFTMADNPSGRRDAVSIFFRCEMGGELELGCLSRLDVTQHKGTEFLELSLV